MELKNISTEELISELLNRLGVTKLAVGPYQPHELICKYSDKQHGSKFNFLIGIHINELKVLFDELAHAKSRLSMSEKEGMAIIKQQIDEINRDIRRNSMKLEAILKSEALRDAQSCEKFCWVGLSNKNSHKSHLMNFTILAKI